jgi:hypothetical protein
MTGTMLIWVVVSIVVLLAARMLVFQASCALVDVQPNLINSLLLPAVFWVGMVALAYTLLWYLLPPESQMYLQFSEPDANKTRLPLALPPFFGALGLTVLGVAIVSWPVYLLALPTSLKKSMWIAVLDQLLLALLAGLIVAAVMVGLAAWQIFTVKPA